MIEAEGTVAGVSPRQADEDGRVTLRLRVNGRDERVRARAHHTLLDVLRNELGLTGPREGCGVGMCGACTVLLDGHPVSSCLLLAPLAQHKDILNIEGLEKTASGELHPVQQAYIDHTGFQCSYCTPGFILSTVALLSDNPDATEDEAREYLSGNLCRCGSYAKILEAVMDARERLRSQ